MDLDFLSVLNESGGDSESNPVELNVHDRIGDGGMFGNGLTSGMFKGALDQIPKEKHLRVSINSMGGDVSHGTAIYNMLRDRGDKVTTRVDGFAASMGGVIAMAGAKRVMMPGTMMILHNPSNVIGGDQRDMERNAQYLKQVKDGLVDIFAARTKQGKRAISDMMDKVTSLSPKQAKELGFCDEVAPGTPANNLIEPVAGLVLERFRAVNVLPDAGGDPAKRQNNEQKRMNKIIATLVAAGYQVAADSNEEAIIPHVTALINERNSARTENEQHRAAQKIRVENRVKSAIAAKKIKPERETSLIALGEKDESVLDFLDDITAPAEPAQPAPTPAKTGRGANPQNLAAASNGNTPEQELESVRAEIAQTKDPVRLAELSRKARSLRLGKEGAENMFRVQEPRRAN